ncbi:hypothetical protein [Pseudomonas sp. Q1-7]|uniref:hypothetical protein n=1 Tax=Pseudomonas sp. Q1-7 TaxID=3020843 RepID=UPI0023002461|nr:hypothetical protein [Pseudomonas sp. Q1-7]
MRTSTLLLLLFLHPSLIWSQEIVSGDMHAVINTDGSISYYLKIAPDEIRKSTTPSISKPAIKQIVGDNKASPKAFEVFGADNELAGYYVSPASSERIEPVAMAINRGYTAKAVSYDSLPESFSQVYKFTNKKGEIGGAWLPASESYGASALGNIIPVEWSTSKLDAPSKTTPSPASNIPVPKEDFIEALRESMLQQAILLACKSKITPKEIAVTAGLAASVGFIVGGEGTISFQATWETEKLCRL